MRQVQLFLTFIFISFTAYSQYNTPEEKDTATENLMKKADIPGLSGAYFEEESILVIAKGNKDTNTEDLVDENTVFSAASLSKPVFAYLIMMLVNEGVIDLDKPLLEYYKYPDVMDEKEAMQVTARHVLSHTSGLPNWRKNRNSPSIKFKYKPGKRFSYSGEGYVWLQKAIENMLEKPLDEIATERIFEPLEMDRTSYIWEERFEGNYAIPHNGIKSKGNKYRNKTANAAASLQTTAKDYMKFVQHLVLDNGIATETLNKMLSSQIEVKKADDIQWCLGLGIQQTADGPQYFQWGDNGDFKGYLTFSKQKRKGLVYFVNSTNGLSITNEMVMIYLSTDQPAMEWLDYKQVIEN